MYSFNYRRAANLKEASAALAANAEAKLLAGGQSLLAAMKLRLARPSDLIDLGGIAELRGIKVDAGKLTIGAMAKHAEVAASAEVRRAIPALAHLAGEIGDRQVRNTGTLGGSLANADPAADYPAAVIGLAATVLTNKRSIAADDFFRGIYTTALGADEIIVAVNFPLPKRAGYAKFKQPASRFALVGVFVAQFDAGVRVAVTGAGPSVFRVADMERGLTQQFAANALDGISVPAAGLNADLHAEADYRAHLVSVMAKRAVAAA